MVTLKYKNPEFPAMQVYGEPSEFSELKAFCGNDVRISYEHAPGIDDYWLIKVNDCLTQRWDVVPVGDYVMKTPEGFTVVERLDVDEYFEISAYKAD